MLTHYFILVAVTATTTLVWRALLLDNPRLLTLIEKIPILGTALTCGFCSAMWLSLAAVIIYNPLTPLFSELHPIIILGLSWFTLAPGILFVRNLIAILIEAGGFLSHLHHEQHKEEK